MKRLVFVFCALMVFSLTSCHEYEDAIDCSKNQELEFYSTCTVIVQENGIPQSGYPITIKYTKWRCNGESSTFTNTYTTNSEGRCWTSEWTFSLHNNNDYVVLEAFTDGKYSFQERKFGTNTFDSFTTHDIGFEHQVYVFNYIGEY